MLLLAPPSLRVPSFFPGKPLEFDMTEYPAEPFIGFQDTEVINRLPSGEVEENQGDDDLLVGPALGLRMEVGRDALAQTKDGGEVQKDGKAGKGSFLILFSLLRTCRGERPVA